MQNVLLIAQIVISVLLIGAILLQAQGSGFGMVWGAGGESYHTKRGVEKVVFVFTIVATCIFAALSILNLIAK